MVDVGLLQSLSYVAAATGVCAASIYYIMALRATQRNMRITLETRKLQFLTFITQSIQNEEGCKRFANMMNMSWSDYDDFEKKYGSDSNIESYAERTTSMLSYNMLGFLLREKLVEPETLYDLGVFGGACFTWNKFESIIGETRKRYAGEDWLKEFELLVEEMIRIKIAKDPSYIIPEALTKYVP